MYRKFLLLSALALGAARTLPADEPADEPALAPFNAHYLAQWKDINVGTSDLVLARASQPGAYVYTWRIRARGIFRIVYSHDVVQTSRFRLDGDRVLPETYDAEDGSSVIHLDFDWPRGRVHGTVAGKPLDLAIEDGTQDLMSIQIQVMRDLARGSLPPKFLIIDKDQVKDFEYTRTGEARIRTELGELDTVVVASRRPGGDRVLTMWFAPSLGFVPVRAERTRAGRLEFAMRIEALSR
jgi:Protein of unknown function (DUF3108)